MSCPGKPTALAAGFVACDPLDIELALDWPMQAEVEIDGIRQRLDNATADPRAVAALRTFHQALADRTARAGMTIEQPQ